MATKSSNTPNSGRARSRWILFAITGLITAVVGGTTLTAVAHSGKDRGGDHGAWSGHKKGPFSEKKVDFMLYQIDATAEQRATINSIVSAAREDMKTMRENEKSGREAFMVALTKPTVDRQELETLRKSHMEAFDKASERMIRAMADAAEVLTPEQRLELAELAEKFGHRKSDATDGRDGKE